MFHGNAEDFSSLHTDLQGLPIERLQFNAEEFQQLLKLANTHHVTVRALRILGNVAHAAGNAQLQEWCEAALAKEQTRIANAVQWLNAIVQCLEDSGCPVCVIKSLDHWPDLGSDLDLYTNGTPEQVVRIQADGTCWLGGTTWRGRHALRVSFSNWSTSEDDVGNAARAILKTAGAEQRLD